MQASLAASFWPFTLRSMIVKDRRPQEHDDAGIMAAAGAKAEAQMAFYLKRAFADDANVLVIHDLRLPSDDGTDAAQIDHLVIHTGGMVIVESKSVTSEVTINESREFTRMWNGRWQGMPSPVQQSTLQAGFLQKTLAAKAAQLRDKALFGLVQKGFGMVPFDVLVAISDTGVIHRKVEVPEVLKADQVVDKVKEIMGRRCVGFATFAMKSKNEDDPWVSFTASEMKRIADFLIASHRPLLVKPALPAVSSPVVKPPAPVPPAPQPAAATPPTGQPKPACRHCSSRSVTMVHGKYGYYFKCQACEKNTPPVLVCSKCGKEARVRKEKLTFHRECQGCGHAEVYHVNVE